jgi:hypothetical protein
LEIRRGIKRGGLLGGPCRRYAATADDPAWFAAQGEPILCTRIAVEKVRLSPWQEVMR